MGPKKKGKGSKLSRMSEEERIRYLQHRAAIEEEARRRKQQLIATFMKNKLKREEAFTRLNLAKINQQWRQILRNIKSSELKEELKALGDSFQHIVKYKTQIIHTLLKDLDASEDQHNRILQSHTEAVDRLLQIHKDRLSHLHIIYKQQRKGLLKATGLENQQIQSTAEENEEYLNTLLYSIQESMDNFQKIGEERQSTKLDEIRNELQFYQEQLENEKESNMERIWREFQTVLKNYFTQTDVSRSHYLRLKEKDSEAGKIIKDCSGKIESLMEQVDSLKLQLLNLRSSQDNTLSGLKQEQNNLVNYFTELRKTMKSALHHDENQLTYMSVCSNKVISELQEQVGKAEQIFNIFSICRKYETEREKVLPFGWDYMSSDEKSDLELNFPVKQEINEPLAQEIFTYSNLDNFWLKYNNAALECAALKLHYNALKVDNQQLQATVRSYLAVVSQGNGNKYVQMPLTGTRPNTRAVRKQITLITGEETKVPKPRPVTCIEASTSIAVQHMIRSKVL